MATKQVVKGGTLSDEQIGQFTRRTDELLRQLKLGTVAFDAAMDELQKLIDSASKEKRAQTRFPTFRRLKLGTHKTVAELRQALVDAGNRIGDYASQILNQISVSLAEGEVDLVVVSNAELGAPNGCSYAETIRLAKVKGLDLCPAEVGPQLRLQYPEQPYGEWLVVAMEAMAGSGGRLCVFSVEHGSLARWLLAYYGDPDDFRYGYCRFVFVRRQPLVA